MRRGVAGLLDRTFGLSGDRGDRADRADRARHGQSPTDDGPDAAFRGPAPEGWQLADGQGAAPAPWPPGGPHHDFELAGPPQAIAPPPPPPPPTWPPANGMSVGGHAGPANGYGHAQDGPGPSGPPNGYGPNGYAPNGYAPNGYAPNGYAPNGYAPNGPNGHAPNGYAAPPAPSAWTPTPAAAHTHPVSPGPGHGAPAPAAHGAPTHGAPAPGTMPPPPAAGAPFGDDPHHGAAPGAAASPPAVPAAVTAAAEEPTTSMAVAPQMLVRSAATAPDPLSELKELAREELFARLGNRLYDRKTTEDELHAYVVGEINTYFDRNAASLPTEHRRRVSRELADDVLRHGPIEPFLVDATVSEIMVNGLRPIWIEREGRLYATTARFSSEAQLRHVIDRIVSRIGRRVDESTPMVDGRLPDGSRINAVLPPLAVDGPSLTVRKFTARTFTPDDLVKHRTATPEVVALLSACVKAKLNVLVSGGTGTGKTTMLNLLSSFVPDGERIVTIEDSCELSLRHENLVRLESRPPNVEGRGEVTARGLLRNALRMRPDRIIVGEVRGGEALDMLQAMNTGHDGSLSTLHANSPRDALSRVETMVLMGGMELPLRAIREQVASAVDLVVHLVRLHDGTRRISHLVEVNGMEGDVITLTDLFVLDQNAGYDEDGQFAGTLQPTGLRPRFADRLLALGVLPADFDLPGFDRRRRPSAPGLDGGRTDERRGAR